MLSVIPSQVNGVEDRFTEGRRAGGPLELGAYQEIKGRVPASSSYTDLKYKAEQIRKWWAFIMSLPVVPGGSDASVNGKTEGGAPVCQNLVGSPVGSQGWQRKCRRLGRPDSSTRKHS